MAVLTTRTVFDDIDESDLPTQEQHCVQNVDRHLWQSLQQEQFLTILTRVSDLQCTDTGTALCVEGRQTLMAVLTTRTVFEVSHILLIHVLQGLTDTGTTLCVECRQALMAVLTTRTVFDDIDESDLPTQEQHCVQNVDRHLWQSLQQEQFLTILTRVTYRHRNSTVCRMQTGTYGSPYNRNSF